MKMRFCAWMSVLALAATAPAAITLNVSHNTGDTISGDVTFTVRASSDSLVTSVEYYVGDDLRDSDQSTPYTFALDTLTENDGPLTVTFAAYNQAGESAKKVLNLKIDNGLNLGEDHHVAQAMEALEESKWDQAILHGRIAIKINPESNGARAALARAYLGKGTLDLAQKYSEDIVASDPNSEVGLQLAAGINLRRAFMVIERGAGGAASPGEILKDAFTSAASQGRKVVDMRLERMGEANDENIIPYTTELIRARRFNAATQLLSPRFNADETNADIGELLAYSLVRSARFEEANRVIRTLERRSEPGTMTYLLKAAMLQMAGDTNGSKAAERDAILMDAGSPTMMSGQMFLAQTRGDVRTLTEFIKAFREAGGNDTIASYYLGPIYYQTRETGAAKDTFERAILLEPISYELLVERALQVMGSTYAAGLDNNLVESRRDQVRAMLEAAIAARPESFEALTALSLLELEEGNSGEALKWARAAVASAPEYAYGHYALAGAYLASGRPTEAKASVDMAGERDRMLAGTVPPKAVDILRMLYQRGRLPWIQLP